MSSNMDARDSDTDSQDILKRAEIPQNITSKEISNGPVARLYCKNRFEYLINKTRVLVGRSGGESKATGQGVDLSIDSCSLYISRRHFDIFTTDCCTFFVSVYSKNGLFVNGLFLRRGSAALQLKNKSRLRFPKTDMKILFEIYEREVQSSGEFNHLVSSFTAGENGDHNSEQISSNLPDLVQSYSMMAQQQMVADDSEKQLDNFLVPSTVPPTKLEREVLKQHHGTQNQTSKKTKFKHVDVDNSINSHQDWKSRGDYADGRKPPFSYSQLIAQAIFSAPDHMLCLNDIYMFITKTYPFYKPEEKGWQNSIRHNLSLSKSFVRHPRANEEGKGSLWSIEYADKQTLLKTAYKPRGGRDKYNQAPPPKIPRIVPEPSLNDSEDSGEVTYQNEDEEAANSIAMSSQVSTESFNFGGGDQYMEGDDQLVKTPQAAILQSSFANPMQIFMQPDRRGNLNQQHINLAQLQQRANAAGSGSVQIVRLMVNPNNPNNELTFGNFDSTAQQEVLDANAGLLQSGQESQIWQPQQVKIQQQPQQQQVPGTGQKIIFLRPAQQQNSDPNMSSPAIVQPKKILLTSGGGPITILNTHAKEPGQPQRIIIAQPQTQHIQLHENLNFSMGDQGVLSQQNSSMEEKPSLQFDMLSTEQQQQVLMQQFLQPQKNQQTNNNQMLQLVTKQEDSKEYPGESVEVKEECFSEQDAQKSEEAEHSNAEGQSREIPIMELESEQ